MTKLQENTTDQEACDQLTEVLVAEPGYIVPAFKALAKEKKLHVVVGRFTSDQWRSLAKAALLNMEMDPDGIANDLQTISPTDMPERSEVHVCEKMISGSLITREAFEHPAVFAKTGSEIWPVAILIALEATPELFQRDQRIIIKRLRGIIKMLSERFTKSEGGGMYVETKTFSGHDIDDIQESKIIEVQVDSNAKNRINPRKEEQEVSLASQRIVPAERTTGSVAQTYSTPDTTENEYPTPDIRQTAFTEFGGLLFILPLIEAIGIPGEIEDHPQLGFRPFRWVLNQFARELVNTDERDPAVMAFCGIAPDDPFPWSDEMKPAESESTVMQDWRSRIAALLKERLDIEESSDERVIDIVCRRRAQILVEPGWLEIVFSIEDISTQIRRATLDLDPGYIPWLGVVLRFRYE